MLSSGTQVREHSHIGKPGKYYFMCLSFVVVAVVVVVVHTLINHGRSYCRGRRGSRLVCFCPDHGYIPKKTTGQGHFGHFWSLRLV